MQIRIIQGVSSLFFLLDEALEKCEKVEKKKNQILIQP